MKTEESKDLLCQYRCILQKAHQVEDRLGEYVQAIEEFGLENPDTSDAPVQCRDGLLSPTEILHRAGTLADQLEQLMQQAATARDNVLTHILRQSTDLAEYRKLRETYVDSVDAAV